MNNTLFEKLSGPAFFVSFSREMLALIFAAYQFTPQDLAALLSITEEEASALLDGQLPGYALKSKIADVLDLLWLHSEQANNLVQFSPRALSIMRRGSGNENRTHFVEKVGMSYKYVQFLEEGRRDKITVEKMRVLGDGVGVKFLLI